LAEHVLNIEGRRPETNNGGAKLAPSSSVTDSSMTCHDSAASCFLGRKSLFSSACLFLLFRAQLAFLAQVCVGASLFSSASLFSAHVFFDRKR
jgi:hypothetical protein